MHEKTVVGPLAAFAEIGQELAMTITNDDELQGLREIGRRIWASCMERTAKSHHGKKQKPHKRRRHH